jgi:hypothetical protein
VTSHELVPSGAGPPGNRSRSGRAGTRATAAEAPGRPAPETVWLNPVCAHIQRPLTFSSAGPA